MKGFGTDEAAIIKILANRNNAQRQIIAQTFKAEHDKNLLAYLKKELSGNFKSCVVGLMTPLYEYLAERLHDALSGIGTKENTLIDIVCSSSNKELKEINETYYKMYDKHLQKDLSAETSKSFQKFIIKESEGNRSESSEVDPEQAKKDATEVMSASVAKWGTDDSLFINILTKNSYPQLKLIFEQYEKMAGKSILETITSELSGDVKNGLLAIVKCIDSSTKYFAERLNQAMKGIGTDDETLTRVIITRCEVDMVEIKQEYLKMHGISLEREIAAETSGDYKKILLALVD